MGAHLEGEMLEKVRGAICLVSLCAGAGVDPHADGRGLGIGGVLGGDLEMRHWSIGAGGGLGRGAHGQAILERRRLRLDAGGVVRRREASPGDDETGSAASQALRQVQSESPGRHGRRLGWRRAEGWMSGLGGRLRGRSIRNHHTKKLGDFASLPRPKLGTARASAPSPAKSRSRGRVSDNPPVRHSLELEPTPLLRVRPDS
jgi:hypothetical protein